MRVVKIRWVDSHSHYGWHSKQEALDFANTKSILVVQSVGFVIEETQDYVLWCSSVGETADNLQSPTIIPRGAILSMHDLAKDSVGPWDSGRPDGWLPPTPGTVQWEHDQ